MYVLNNNLVRKVCQVDHMVIFINENYFKKGEYLNVNGTLKHIYQIMQKLKKIIFFIFVIERLY